LRTELEIDNDTLPLKGKFIFHDLQRKGKMSGIHTLEFNQGTIKEGNLYLKHGQDSFGLALHKGDGKMKLEGDFNSMGYRGTISLDKKWFFSRTLESFCFKFTRAFWVCGRI
jgi:hypothetical protein